MLKVSSTIYKEFTVKPRHNRFERTMHICLFLLKLEIANSKRKNVKKEKKTISISLFTTPGSVNAGFYYDEY